MKRKAALEFSGMLFDFYDSALASALMQTTVDQASRRYIDMAALESVRSHLSGAHQAPAWQAFFGNGAKSLANLSAAAPRQRELFDAPGDRVNGASLPCSR